MYETIHKTRSLMSVFLLSLPLFVGCAPQGPGAGRGDDFAGDDLDGGLDDKGKATTPKAPKPPKPPKGGGTTGGTTGGGTTGGTTGGGTTGGTSGGIAEPWCAGEDASEPPTPDTSGPCTICGGRELNVENWRNDGPCLQAWSKVASLNADSAQCRAVAEEKGDLCCLGFYEHPARTQCAQMGPYQSVDLCADGCFPSNAGGAGVYSLQAGGPLSPWVNGLGDRRGTCYQDDGNSAGALVWTCRRAYYLLKYGHLPAPQANEVISWWRGGHSLSVNCGCDDKNTKNPNYTN